MNVDRPTRGLRVPWLSRRSQRVPNKPIGEHLPFPHNIPRRLKGHVVACVGEFVGTFMFLLFAFGGTNVVNTAPAEGANAVDLSASPSKIMYISLVFGFSLAVNAWVFFRISGGLFNPAVTLGMMAVGAMGYMRGLLIMFSQILGGVTAAAVVSAMMPDELAVATELSGRTTVVQGLFIEMFLTAQLVFTIFMLATEKHEGTFIAPIGIGLSLFVAELMGVFYTGGSLNPARSFAPAVVTHQFRTYHWIYWVGPALGALLASAFYTFVKALEYETVNLAEEDLMAHQARKLAEKNSRDELRSLHSSRGRAFSSMSEKTFVQAPAMENGPTPPPVPALHPLRPMASADWPRPRPSMNSA